MPLKAEIPGKGADDRAGTAVAEVAPAADVDFAAAAEDDIDEAGIGEMKGFMPAGNAPPFADATDRRPEVDVVFALAEAGDTDAAAAAVAGMTWDPVAESSDEAFRSAAETVLVVPLTEASVEPVVGASKVIVSAHSDSHGMCSSDGNDVTTACLAAEGKLETTGVESPRARDVLSVTSRPTTSSCDVSTGSAWACSPDAPTRGRMPRPDFLRERKAVDALPDMPTKAVRLFSIASCSRERPSAALLLEDRLLLASASTDAREGDRVPCEPKDNTVTLSIILTIGNTALATNLPRPGEGRVGTETEKRNWDPRSRLEPRLGASSE